MIILKLNLNVKFKKYSRSSAVGIHQFSHLFLYRLKLFLAAVSFCFTIKNEANEINRALRIGNKCFTRVYVICGIKNFTLIKIFKTNRGIKMRKLIFLLLFLIYPFVIHSQSDWEPGNRMNQAISSLLLGYESVLQSEEGKYLENYGFNSISGSYLKMGEKSFIRTTLSKSTTYILMAGGDKSTFDVDIIIKDENKNIIKRDIRNDKYAVVFFVPDYDGTYIIELSASGVTGKGFSVIAILEEGTRSNLEDIIAAIENMQGRWNQLTGKFDVSFASDPEALDGDYSYRSFCWNGFYVDKASSYGFNENGITPNKSYLIMATGDNNATSIYLYVKYDGKESWDKEHDTSPFVLFTPKSLKQYDFAAYNQNKSLRTFIITCLFEMAD